MTDVKFIKNISIFKDLDEEEIKKIAGIANEKTYPPKTVIFSEGQAGSKLFIVKQGSVRITKVIREGEKQILDVVEEGEYFGKMSFIDGGEHSATVETINETTLISIEKADFEKLAVDDPEGGFRIMKALAVVTIAILREMNDKFVELVNYMWGGRR
ncbi:MAG: cyclic nucleotide-binding domain-containing protein [bacterium]